MFIIKSTTTAPTQYLLSFDENYQAVTTSNKLEAFIFHSEKQARRVYSKLKFSDSNLSDYSPQEIDYIQDSKNINFTFSSTDSEILKLIANMDIDAVKLAKAELQKRGHSVVF